MLSFWSERRDFELATPSPPDWLGKMTQGDKTCQNPCKLGRTLIDHQSVLDAGRLGKTGKDPFRLPPRFPKNGGTSSETD